MMVAIPELDGAHLADDLRRPLRSGAPAANGRRDMAAHAGARRDAGRARRPAGRAAPQPSAPSASSRSCCSTSRPTPARSAPRPISSVFASLHNTLRALRDGRLHASMCPTTSTRCASMHPRAATRRASAPHANVAARIPADDHVRRERWLAEIERQWGPAPGRQQSDGAGAVRARRRNSATSSSACSRPSATRATRCGCCSSTASRRPTPSRAFYRWIREDFGAHAVLHFGTHGALEFMPGKQAGLSGDCWPDRLIGDLPNFYLYASNNPSEGMLAKRRAGADADQLSDAAGRRRPGCIAGCST